MKRPTCPIHGTELEHSYPPDPENGPHPSDAFNELFCVECAYELDRAELDSLCLPHHAPIGNCAPCFLAQVNDEFVEIA